MKGFTLLEILLVIALITVVSVISPPIYTKIVSQTAINSNISTLISVLHKAQSNSLASLYDSVWGVKIENNKFTLFKGNDYSSRDQNFDEPYDSYGNFTTSGDNEIIFPKLNTLNKKYLVVISNDEKTINLNINEFGVIDY